MIAIISLLAVFVVCIILVTRTFSPMGAVPNRREPPVNDKRENNPRLVGFYGEKSRTVAYQRQNLLNQRFKLDLK